MAVKTHKLQTNKLNLERYPSGQREQTVNLSADAFEGSNPSLSIFSVLSLRFTVHSKTFFDYSFAGVTQLVESSIWIGRGLMEVENL